MPKQVRSATDEDFAVGSDGNDPAFEEKQPIRFSINAGQSVISTG